MSHDSSFRNRTSGARTATTIFRWVLGSGVLTSIAASPAIAQAGDIKDLTVAKLGYDNAGNNHDIHYWGTTAGGMRAYSFATQACNEGTTPIPWVAGAGGRVNIAQNIFRVVDGRLEQLGYSWIKLASCAASEPGCGGCQATPCSTLGVGCADTYWAMLNDGQEGHAKFDVNPTTGEHFGGLTPPSGGTQRGRLRISESEMGVPGAVYFAEAQYVVEADHKQGLARNNNSYRLINTSSFSTAITGAGPTVRNKAAVDAWRDLDPTVTVVDVINDQEPTAVGSAVGIFLLGYKVTEIGGGEWRYEYAIQNLTSDQAGASGPPPFRWTPDLR